MNGSERDRRLNLGLTLAALVASLANLSLVSVGFLQGADGQVRGAFLLVGATVYALGELLRPGPVPTLIRRGVLAVLAVGVLDLILHSPGSSLVGVPPRFLSDFEINLTAAGRNYRADGPPDGIQQGLAQSGDTIGFPFPNSWIYWASSGFGIFDLELTGGVFTALNLVAAMLLTCRSFRLAGMRTKEAEMFWFLLFLSPLWGGLVCGQTVVMAAALIVAGWLHCQSEKFGTFSLGVAMVALGFLIEPRYAPILFAIFLEWISNPKDSRPLRTLVAIPAVAALFVASALLIPGGVGIETLEDFKEVAMGGALTKVAEVDNLSVPGFINRFVPAHVPPATLALILGLALGGLGWVKRLDWRYWFLLPLVILPTTRQVHLALALPVEFALVGSATPLERTLLILAVGLIGSGVSGAGAAGMLILLALVLRCDQTGVPGNR